MKPADRIEEEILKAVRRIRYGSVEITIHDSRVVQIEQKEKVRIVSEDPGRER
jgi:hypothetical protein